MSAVATPLRAHPAADAFPIVQKTIDELAEDIAKSGQQFPITVSPDGLVIDGRHRWLACQRLGIEPQVDVWDDATEDDIVDFVISANVCRYHLEPGVLAAAALELANLKRGDNQHASAEATSQREAGDRLGVSRATIQRAKFVKKHGTPAINDALATGELPVKTAVRAAKLPREEQPQTLDEIREAKAKPKDERPAWASPQKLDTDPDTSVPDPNTGDLDLGEDEEREVPEWAQGPTPDQIANNDPEVRWHRVFRDFYRIVSSLRDMRGMRFLAKRDGWSEDRIRSVQAEFDRAAVELGRCKSEFERCSRELGGLL